jgi:hypothetical protein
VISGDFLVRGYIAAQIEVARAGTWNWIENQERHAELFAMGQNLEGGTNWSTPR